VAELKEVWPARTILKYETDIVEEALRLIAIRSVKGPAEPGKPYGAGVDRALQYMLSLGERLGFRSTNLDGYAGHIEFGEGDEYVGVLVHLDTVDAGDGWTVDPFGGVVRDGLLIGRGASDNKGPAVVALYALAALRDAILMPETKIRIILGTDEESGMSDMDYYFAKEPPPKYAFAPDAAYPIIHAEKGYYVLTVRGRGDERPSREAASWRLAGGDAANVVPDRCSLELRFDGGQFQRHARERLLAAAATHPHVAVERESSEGHVRLSMRGKLGHGSYPPSGINAVARMLEFMADALPDTLASSPLLAFVHSRIGHEAFGETLGLAAADPTHGRLTVNLGVMKAGWDGEQAEPAYAALNVRYPVTSDGAAVFDAFRSRCESHGLQAAVERHMPPLYVPESHPLLVKLGGAYEAVMEEPAKLLSIGGGTYARKLQGRGVAFGAGFPGRNHGPGAHQPDETASIADLMLHGRICTQALYELQRRDG